MKVLLKKKKKKNLKTEMNLYSIESIHLKTSKEKRRKEMNKRTCTTTTTKKNKVLVRSGEDALLLGSLGLLG